VAQPSEWQKQYRDFNDRQLQLLQAATATAAG
jgi:formate dehydrogenase major subunit